MRCLTDDDAIHIWESALTQRPFERALTILAAALPEASADEIAAYPVGRRNELLFRVRAILFGERLTARAPCPDCSEWLEFTLSAEDLGVTSGDPGVPDVALPQQMVAGELAIDGLRVTFRLPDSHDLAASANYPDAHSARNLLIRRCVIAVDPPLDLLPDAMIALLGQTISERDPLAAITLSFTCPNCGHAWAAPFDILAYFWEELAAHVRSLTLEVAALARSYGWRETDILAMSAARRKIYLELLTS